MEARKHPTIRDVAARAGVSKSLVSLALHGSTRVSKESREAILTAANDLGYRPNAAARTLVAQRTRTIGVFVLDLHNPISADFIDAIQQQARLRDYRTILVTGSDDRGSERAELEKLMELRVEGMVIVGHRLPSGARDVIGSSFPAVLVTSEDRSIPYLSSICNDDVAGAGLAVDHLVALGHRRIAHVTGGENSVALRRQQGYEAAMRAHRLTTQIRVFPGAFSDSGGYRGMAAALDSSAAPTAVFVCSDYAAVGAIAAAEERGLRIPEDISIVGYDGTRLAGLRSVSLTTVAQPIQQLGSLAAGILCDTLDHTARSRKATLLAPELIVRGSTSPQAPPSGRSEGASP